MDSLFIPVESAELAEEITAGPSYYVPEQFGPLRQFEKEMRCASRGCGSSTFFKVSGIPRCMIHALRELNQMLVELGQEGGDSQ